MKRDIITIDEEKCTGCGLCIPGCPEGALQIINSKARLVSDLFCDGLGACIGTCPEGAIEIEQREAEPYDEHQVMTRRIIPKGKETITAHLKHLRDHGAHKYFGEAAASLRASGFPDTEQILSQIQNPPAEPTLCGCLGAFPRDFTPKAAQESVSPGGGEPSALSHWPVQMHLLNPEAPHYRGSDFVLAADCCAFAFRDFHAEVLAGRTLGIACPKLDQGLEIYRDKLAALIDNGGIETLTVVVMEVPCCRGLVKLAADAARNSQRNIPVRMIQIGIRGEIQLNQWISPDTRNH